MDRPFAIARHGKLARRKGRKMTDRESILQALFALLKTITDATVLRNEALPEKIPDGGLIILRDGDPGEPETLLSPLSYYWQHRALVEAVVQKGDQAARDLALDGLYRKISLAIAGDRTLGGLCDRVMPQAPDSNVLAVEGSPQIKGAIIPIELIYVTTDPLG
jgi:hypothetical protein